MDLSNLLGLFKVWKHVSGPEGRKPVGPLTIGVAIIVTLACLGYMAYRMIVTH